MTAEILEAPAFLPQAPASEYLVSIRDAARIVGVAPHTLRYWEKEFEDFLRPPRTQGKQRRYGDEQLAKLRRIFRMLKEEGYSIAGAKRSLARENRGANVEPAGDAAEELWASLTEEMTEKILEMVKKRFKIQAPEAVGSKEADARAV